MSLDMIPEQLLPPSFIRARRDAENREIAERLQHCVPWDPDMPWSRRLNIQAKTYKPRQFFDVKLSSADVGEATPDQMVLSPKGTFCYVEKRLKKGYMLPTVYGRDSGTVLFDGQIRFPALHDKTPHSWLQTTGGWRKIPWMSITPFEMMSLRAGTARAKGTTIIAGLGLGHQLIEVSKRQQVKRLVLVEQSQELVDWLLPRIKPYMVCGLADVVVGDAYKVMPKMKADVALVDIFPGYGGNADDRDRLRRTCPDIKFIWAWGTQFAA